MKIDIRDLKESEESEEITEIVFDGENSDSYRAHVLKDSGRLIHIKNIDGDKVYIRKTSIDNLIEALLKAKELWG